MAARSGLTMGKDRNLLDTTIVKYSKSIQFSPIGSDILKAIGRFLLGIVENDHGGWAFGEAQLGSQKDMGVFIRISTPPNIGPNKVSPFETPELSWQFAMINLQLATEQTLHKEC